MRAGGCRGVGRGLSWRLPSVTTLFTAFQSRNYRLYFAGQLVSLVGNWMTQTASVWLVYQLTGSPTWLGIVAFASQAPIVLLSPLAGVWVDRWNRLTLLKVTQVLSMVLTFLLAAIALSGHMHVAALTALAIAQGAVNAFDMPTRQSLAVQLAAKREHLSAVIGMNSSMFNLARLIGPSIGGLVIARFGAGLCFLFDGLSYLAVLAALAAMRLPGPREGAGPGTASAWASFREGLRYAHGFRPIRFLILFNASMSLFALSFTVLIPVYAQTVLKGDARTLGFLMSSSAVGAVAAALFLAGRRDLRGIGRVIVAGCLMAGAALGVFAWSRALALSMACLAFVGLGGLLVIVANNTLVQTLVDEDKRGRVMSLFAAAFLCGMPLGSLLTGALAEHLGIAWATTINALASVALGFVYLRQRARLRAESRPVLVQRGALPAAPG